MNVKYEKSIYQAKITELEGYYSQLQIHLSNMENYKAKMFEFWNDERAQKVGKILAQQIRDVKKVMSQTSVEIATLKNTVEKLGGVATKQDQELDTVFRALEVAAEFIPQ